MSPDANDAVLATESAKSPVVANVSEPDLERVRQLVREEILELATRAKREQTNKVWKFLNTGFGLWILSSIVLTSVTAAYSTWSTRVAAERDQLQHFKRLDAEIDLRYRRTLPAVTAAIADRKRDAIGGLKRVRTPLDAGDLSNLQLADILLPPASDVVYLHEYRDRNVLSLFAEAQSIARSENEKIGIGLAINRLEAARIYYQEAVDLAAGRLPKTGRGDFVLRADGNFSFKDWLAESGRELPTEEDAKAAFVKAQLVSLRNFHMTGRPHFDRSIVESLFFWKHRNDLSQKQVKEGPSDNELSAFASEFVQGVGQAWHVSATLGVPKNVGTSAPVSVDLSEVQSGDRKPFLMELMVMKGKRLNPKKKELDSHRISLERNSRGNFSLTYQYGETSISTGIERPQAEALAKNGLSDSQGNYVFSTIAARGEEIPDGTKQDETLANALLVLSGK